MLEPWRLKTLLLFAMMLLVDDTDTKQAYCIKNLDQSVPMEPADKKPDVQKLHCAVVNTT